MLRYEHNRVRTKAKAYSQYLKDVFEVYLVLVVAFAKTSALSYLPCFVSATVLNIRSSFGVIGGAVRFHTLRWLFHLEISCDCYALRASSERCALLVSWKSCTLLLSWRSCALLVSNVYYVILTSRECCAHLIF